MPVLSLSQPKILVARALQKLLLIGANQITMRCNTLEVSEQMTPMINSRRIASNTVCSAFLDSVNQEPQKSRTRTKYGTYE